MENFIYEEFNNINHLLSTLEKRENNSFMKDCHSSERNGKDFTGTYSWNEAVSLFKNGYTQYLSKIKSSIRINNAKYFKDIPNKRRPLNMVVGFVPNVSNALQNRPDSMINIVPNIEKKKILQIHYSIAGSCGEPVKTFIEAGISLVSAINILELSGVQTRLFCDFMSAEEENEIICPTIKIKDFGERFNLEKICFPLIHPSMFRRIGFKYLETCPKMTKDFSDGYGHPAELTDLKTSLQKDEMTVVLNTAFIKGINYDVEKILKEFKCKITE